MRTNKITKIVVERFDNGDIRDIEFYFEGSRLPYGLNEFVADTKTRKLLDIIWDAVEDCQS